MSKRKYVQYAILAIRLLLGFIFLLSGVGKLINASDAQYLVELLATKFYWLIEYSSFIVISISILEIIIAIFLLWNKLLRTALTGAFIMLISFSSVLFYFYAQGMEVKSCGCFGAFGFSLGIEFTLIRNIVLMILVGTAFVLITFRSSLERKS